MAEAPRNLFEERNFLDAILPEIDLGRLTLFGIMDLCVKGFLPLIIGTCLKSTYLSTVLAIVF